MVQTGARDCETATSPLAYLADLLGYVTKHVKDGAGELTLPGLTARFHQPFADLPASCACMDSQVSEARIAIDVLRSYLTAKGLPTSGAPAQAALAAAEKSYRLAAYDALLRQLGASFDDVRSARAGTADERAALAERLGIAADKLDALPVAPGQITEAALETLFGLADSGRDPLSDGAKSGDPQGQVTRWSLDGVRWKQDTDPAGMIHLRLKKEGNAFQVTAFRDAARAQAVASGTRNTAIGPVTLTATAGSGPSGSLTIRHTTDSDTIAIAAVPAVLAWRLDRLRAQWREQDAADTTPVIDPDLIAETDLRTRKLADPAFALWKNRRDFIAQTLARLKGLRQPNRSALDNLDAMLREAKVPSAELQALAARLAKGESITTEVEALRLSPASFTFLLRIRKLAQGNGTVLEAEWADVESILVQALKREALAGWPGQERQAQVCLSPDFFLSDGPAVPLTSWRSSAGARADWLARLQARSEQEQALVSALRTAVRAAEEAALPVLRDALILASDAEGGELAAKARG